MLFLFMAAGIFMHPKKEATGESGFATGAGK